MRISGLQKLTLLDFPGKVACTVFTGGCNFRCPFCHNASLVLPEKMPEELQIRDILNFLDTRIGVLDGVAITGGEPLLHSDITELLQEIRNRGFQIKLDTNGSFPDRLIHIVESGLVDKVAMDIKNSPESYSKATGTDIDLSAIESSKDFLMNSGIDYEFRTTVVKGIHTEESIRGAAEWIQGAKAYFLQQYINSGEVIQEEGLDSFDKEEMQRLCECAREFVPDTQLRGIS